MKDKNGINTECYNCAIEEICKESVHCGVCKIGLFLPSKEAYEDRIEDLQKELAVVQESERAEAQEADRLRAEVKELGKKLTETIKLLSESSRECGELEAHNEVLRRRVQEFSMELLEQNMRDNKDVLERLKNWEEYLDKDMSTQSTDADDVSKKIRETDMSNIWWR